MLNNYKIIFSLATIREISFKPLLYLAICIKAKRFYIKIQIIFLFLKAII
jgi:hypothetical protein